MNIDHLSNSFDDRHIKDLLMHPHYSCDGIKIQIKEYLQQHGLTQKQKQNNQILNLTNRLSKLRKNNGSHEDIDQVETKLIELEQKLAERLAIKSRSQCLEQGERSTKYLLRRITEKLQ